MIKGKNITLKLAKNALPTLSDLFFHLEEGRMTSVIGPSGAGKTSLLKCIANIYKHYEGQIEYEDAEIRAFSPVQRISNIGFVFQQFNLFPHLTVLQNCMHPLVGVLKMSTNEAYAKATKLLDSLDMLPFLNVYPSKLSGGQQQRVAIARALGLQPKVLLFDEPTSALDPDSKSNLEAVLHTLKQQGITIAISSHDMPFVKRMVDRIYFMEKGSIVEEYDRLLNSMESCPKIHHFINQG